VRVCVIRWIRELGKTAKVMLMKHCNMPVCVLPPAGVKSELGRSLKGTETSLLKQVRAVDCFSCVVSNPASL